MSLPGAPDPPDGETLRKSVDDAFHTSVADLFKVFVGNLAGVPSSFRTQDDCSLAFRKGLEVACRARQLAIGVADQVAAGGRGRN